jgi:hypothetical protein
MQRTSLTPSGARSEALSAREIRLHQALRLYSSLVLSFAQSRAAGESSHKNVVDAFRELTTHIDGIGDDQVRAWLLKLVRSRVAPFKSYIHAQGQATGHVTGLTARAIVELSSEHQEMLELKFRFGLSYTEISTIMVVPMSQVASFMHQSAVYVQGRLAIP